MANAPQRLDFAPLEREARTTVSNLAKILGVSDRTVWRYRKEGIPVSSADRAAIRIGSHPAYIWMGE